jgi:carbamoylphosphate synthase large subunit
MYKNRYLRVYSRHPSHNVLRKSILLPNLYAIRFGSSTEPNVNYKLIINSTEAIKNSSNKLRMKTKFTEVGVKTADWWTTDNGQGFKPGKDLNNLENLSILPYPIVAKHIYGSRGRGNTLIHSQEELEKWIVGKQLNHYIFERFYSYSKEYRLHVSTRGECFYTCRKMLKADTPEQDRWRRHDDNSVWILEDNPSFDKPINWDEIVEHSVKALKTVGLDIGAIDLKVQSSTHPDGSLREICDFIVLEINSAPSFGDITSTKYAEEIPKLINYLEN